jgi:hypothetical protein
MEEGGAQQPLVPTSCANSIDGHSSPSCRNEAALLRGHHQPRERFALGEVIEAPIFLAEHTRPPKGGRQRTVPQAPPGGAKGPLPVCPGVCLPIGDRASGLTDTQCPHHLPDGELPMQTTRATTAGSENRPVGYPHRVHFELRAGLKQ